jgi:hypothetical protein
MRFPWERRTLWCREQVKLAGLGDTSCGRSFALRPPEERCLRRTFPGGTVRTISWSRPAQVLGHGDGDADPRLVHPDQDRFGPSRIPSFSARHKRIEQLRGDSGKNPRGGAIDRSLRSRGAIPGPRLTGTSAPDTESGATMVVRERFSYKAIHDVLSGLLEHGLHAKRVNSLCDATLGVLHRGSRAVCTIGQGLAAARSLKPKHAIKQSLPPRRRESTGCCPIQQSTSMISVPGRQQHRCNGQATDRLARPSLGD